MLKHDQTIILASYYFFLQIFMNVKISWSIDCNIGAWGFVQSVQFGEPSLRDRESMRVHYWPDLLFNISSPEKTKQGGSVCMGWGTNYVFRTNWQLSRPSIKGRILVSYNFYVLLCFRSQWQMHLPCHINLVGYIQVKMEAIAFCRLLTLSGADNKQRRPCLRILPRPPHKKRDQREETNLINQFPGSSEHALRLHPASLRLFLSSFLAPLIWWRSFHRGDWPRHEFVEDL